MQVDGMADQSSTPQDFDSDNCFPINESGFSFKKSFRKMNKKLSGTIAFRLKTNVPKALLKENTCDDRKLVSDIGRINQLQKQRIQTQCNKQLNFTYNQKQRKEMWSKKDCYSLDRLNFPLIQSGDKKLHSASLRRIYTTPGIEQLAMTVPLTTEINGNVETKLVEYRDNIYLTKLPQVCKLSDEQKRRYDGYRGADLMQGRAIFDERFQRLSLALSDIKCPQETQRKIGSFGARSLSQPSLGIQLNESDAGNRLAYRNTIHSTFKRSMSTLA